MYCAGMRAEILKPLAHDELDSATVRITDDIEGTTMKVELTLAGDPMGLSGSPVPFVITGFRLGLAGLGRRLGWEGVTGTMLRKLPLGRYAEVASRLLIEDLRARGKSRPVRDLESLRRAAGAGPTDEVLQLVGELYGEALVEGGRPAKTIAQQLDLSSATTTRWIRKARDKGYVAALKSELREGGKKS